MSYRYCQRRFGEPSNAVGQSIRINNHPFTVVGVAPPEFFGADPQSVPYVWVPMHANLLLSEPAALKDVASKYLNRNHYWIQVMGRLQPGVSKGQAEATLAPQFQQFALMEATP